MNYYINKARLYFFNLATQLEEPVRLVGVMPYLDNDDNYYDINDAQAIFAARTSVISLSKRLLINFLKALCSTRYCNDGDIMRVVLEANNDPDVLRQYILYCKEFDLSVDWHKHDLRVLHGYDKATALQLACEFGSSESISMLIDAGADTTALDSNGYSALHYAISSGKMENVTLILKQECCQYIINISASQYGITPLFMAFDNIRSFDGTSYELLSALLHRGANLNQQDCFGRTVFHNAAESGNIQFVAEMLDICCDGGYYFDKHIVDKDGFTAESLARYEGFHDVAELIQNYENSISSL